MSTVAKSTPMSLATSPHALEDVSPEYDSRLQYAVTRLTLGASLASTQTTQTFDTKGNPKDMDHDK